MSTDPHLPPSPDSGADSTPPSASVPPFDPPPQEAPYGTPSGPPRSGSDRFFDSIRRSGLARSEDRWVGGVAGGVAERLGWDPLLVRGILFLSFFLTGIGLVAYALGWALLPERRDGRIHIQQALHGDFDVALVGAGLALIAGFSWSNGLGTWWFRGDFGWIVTLFWIAVWITVGCLLLRFVRDRRRAWRESGRATSRPTPSGPGAPQAYAGPTGPAYPGPTTPYPAQPSAGQPGSASATGASSSAAFAGAPDGVRASVPPEPGDDPRTHAERTRAANQARAAARAQAADARVEAARARAAAAREQAHLKAATQQQRARERAAERASKPVTKSAGAATLGVVVGLVLIAGALLMAQDRTGLSLPWPFDGGVEPVLAWLGLALVVVGAAIVVSGIRGRSSGWLGFLAIVGLVVALPWSIGASGDGFPGLYITRDIHGTWRDVGTRGTDVSEGTVAPRSLAEAERGFRVQFGDPTIDLSGLDLSDATTDDPVEVPIRLTAGDLTVVVPRDAAVEADVRLLAGQVIWQVDPGTRTLSRVGSSTAHLSSDEAIQDGATLRLLVSAGAGNVTVTEN
ncbi:PspC domain-containing protein [Xylanimonas allomyrinae]|uniref:PspC domain-containing protein n=1 Tax=Xylanimonas allomyrinae TaxID=2509459 RepID=A0A4P6ESI7_9MICO|nr:PspC domain-containing protein [Xylanimonas allomyrinae]QAY64499.1 PspC domain-containing protein [Xylanimonas allomyrinae]